MSESVGFEILGLGTAVPPHRVDQAASVRMAAPLCCQTAQQARLLPTLFRRSGVRSRGSILLEETDGSVSTQAFYPPPADQRDLGPTTGERMRRFHELAVPLAVEASTAALAHAGLEAGRITHLITVSCTGLGSPGLDISLGRTLGLSPEVLRTNIGFMGCHGAFNGLRVASALAETARDAVVLLCATELCSLHFGYGWNPQQIVANALFADGAAAVVGRGTRGPGRRRDRASGGGHWRLVASGSSLVPETEDAMTWYIGDHGFEMTLSPRIPQLIRTHLRPWLESWLRTHGRTIDHVRSWAVHPGGPRVLGAVAAALGIETDDLADSYAVLAECGNMSSPTVLFIVERLRRRNAPGPSVALGFGPGLSIEAMLLEA